MFENIDRCCESRESLEVTYTVDGYKAAIWTHSKGQLREAVFAYGKTVHAALTALDARLSGLTLEWVRSEP